MSNRIVTNPAVGRAVAETLATLAAARLNAWSDHDGDGDLDLVGSP